MRTHRHKDTVKSRLCSFLSQVCCRKDTEEPPPWKVLILKAARNDLALFYSSISTLNILLQMLKSLYEKKNGSSLTLTHVHKLGLRSLWKEIEQSRFYKNIARVNILRQIHQFSGFLDRGGVIYNLHSRRKRLVCSCSAFNFNGLLILTSIQPEVKSLKFWPFCVILNISRGLRRWDALL